MEENPLVKLMLEKAKKKEIAKPFNVNKYENEERIKEFTEKIIRGKKDKV